jgi:conjugative transfer pilus assembly protein TraH
MRAPIRNINLVAFDPPRWSAGCGGIDMFGGSFSFINSDQLVALFRQVAANAVGLAFKAALDQINPSLAKQIQDFQSKIQALNEMMSNTCAVANSLVKSVTDPGAVANEAQNVVKAAGAAAGSFVDLFGATTKMFDKPTANAKTEEMANNGEPELQNPTWAAMYDSGAADLFGNPSTGETDQNGNRELMMSLLGTVLKAPKDSSQNNADGSQSPKTGTAFEPTFGLMDLIRGAGANDTPLDVYRCEDGYGRTACRKISAVKLNYKGITGYVNRMLFGNDDGNYSASSTSGIVGKISVCNTGSGDSVCGLTNAEKTFLESISSPAFALMRSVQHEQGALVQVATQLRPLMINEIGLKFGEGVVASARKAFYKSKYPRPPSYDAAMNQLLADIRAIRQQDGERLAQLQRVKESNAVILGANPALYVRKR